MPKHIALLRAINVGGRVVKMDELRSIFKAMAFANVETFIASGNVIFDSKSKDARALETNIAKQLGVALGYAVPVYLRSAAEMCAVAAYEPFAPAEMTAGGHSVYVIFLAEEPVAEAAGRLRSLHTAHDEFHVHGREVYWLCRKKISDSEITPLMMDKAIGQKGTSRNITTVRKLAAKYPCPQKPAMK